MLMKAKQPKKTRSRTEAAPSITQTREEVIANIKRIGDLQRERERVQTSMNDAVAQLQERAAEEIAPFDAEIEELQASILMYCTTNRDVLTDGGKVKFADLITGKVLWRNNPPKVQIRGNDAVLALLEQDEKYERFVRTKREVNKEAVLNEPDFFAGNPVPGLSIVQGKEFFVIEPYNQELPGV
ncbi:host-nuclease inhibitor Gam family protein [Vitreoscilla massiliensis]|uniref:Host-nuclease inhibitor Gam family protein n=1 Tax=Vitreoscilla massiliensis TaxID=1689272 RepID=A0ABY4E1E8_9NEIS|nr:host-nuclease inhibitor Gam family protein [Vitreoscilla massiliensis]UOO89618.1 host-nuclease inhibitor Gam family protein [Vitreoscilla massiliensis]